MVNNLIKNETNVFYTVKTSENVVVSNIDSGGSKLYGVEVSRFLHRAKQFPNKEIASKVAAFVDGKLIKHTRTEVVTEVTEELKLKEGN